MSSSAVSGAAKPPIHISEHDYDVVADLALRLEGRNPDLARLILDEINRAQVQPATELPGDVVTLDSEVTFADDSGSEARKVQLVLPSEADIEAGKVSVMTPVGAGLIGMRVGASIDWPTPDGRPRTLKILSVRQPDLAKES